MMTQVEYRVTLNHVTLTGWKCRIEQKYRMEVQNGTAV